MKKTAFLLSIIFLISFLTSCNIINIQTESSNIQTLQTTKEPEYGYMPAPTFFYSTEELIDALDDGSKNVFNLIKNEGKLYYPEIKVDGYTLYTIHAYDASLVYTFFPNEAFKETDDMFYMATFYTETYIITVPYYKMSYSEAIEAYLDKDSIILDNGDIYDTYVKILSFEYLDTTYQLRFPQSYEGEPSWQDTIEIKSIDVKQ